jgi:hypothetical protein
MDVGTMQLVPITNYNYNKLTFVLFVAYADLQTQVLFTLFYVLRFTLLTSVLLR